MLVCSSSRICDKSLDMQSFSCLYKYNYIEVLYDVYYCVLLCRTLLKAAHHKVQKYSYILHMTPLRKLNSLFNNYALFNNCCSILTPYIIFVSALSMPCCMVEPPQCYGEVQRTTAVTRSSCVGQSFCKHQPGKCTSIPTAYCITFGYESYTH